ncbi:MAG: peptide chain release factor N(5)-glutamine methyltransferase [Candidatus Zixiibacteriota bacterium]|nr:MAG: peptide chain release factor N(5)-glutamine methyltransferase [candidate division Zixibacteria bacterium]
MVAIIENASTDNISTRVPAFIAEQAKRLKAVGISSASAEVEWILCHVLEVSRLDLYLHGAKLLNPERRQQIEAIIRRRLTREPLQFILGEAFFYGRRFIVTPAVMAPTPETEGLVERALGFVRTAGIPSPAILDVGVGSGVIALTMACELPSARVVAVDISPAALEVAQQNAALLSVNERVDLRVSDFFSAVCEDEQFDLILSNPPYIAEPDYDSLDPEIHADPKIALTAGKDGLDCIKVIVREAPRFLRAGGRIMFEIGYGQADKVAALVEADKRYVSLDIIKDLNDIDRIVILGCG